MEKYAVLPLRFRKTHFLLIALMLGITSCLNNDKKTSRSVNDSAPRRKLMSWEQMLADAGKDHKICGTFDVSKDTIVLLRGSFGIELSTDHGKTWTWLGKKIFRLNEFTIDDKGTWWGLERWAGIHEPSYCMIHSSVNAGKTWITYEFNTNNFFPFHIDSKPREPLEITDFRSKKIYRLSGRDASHNWQFVKQLPENDNQIADLSVENYFISNNNDNNKLYVKRENGITDTLMSFKKAYNIYNIKKIKNTVYVTGPSSGDINSYFAVIKNERLLQEFTIPGGDINLIKTQFNRIYLNSTSGAYQYKNNKVINIYK